MLHLTRKAPGAAIPTVTLTAPFELRQRSRARVRLDDGSEAALFLPRGDVLRGGDLLYGDGDAIVGVIAAPEPVSTALGGDARLLARAAYHLGNRHVPVQIGEGWLHYPQDHVLDAMVHELGLEVVHETAPFEPETGAYHRHG